MATPETHALLSASSAARWLACPPSVRLCEHLPATTSQYAEEGRLAHSLGELKLRKLFGTGSAPMKPSAYKKALAQITKDALYQPEMDACTDEYVQHIQDIALQYSERPMVALEQQVDFSEWVPQAFGTADCILLTPDALHVCDYKHGKGVPVAATENPQLKLYALGALARYAPFYPDVQEVYLHIIQPRAGGTSVWQTTRAALEDWAVQTVRPAAQLAWMGGGTPTPGEAQCRFCPLRRTCRARAEQVRNVAALPGYGKLPPELTDAEVGEALALGTQVAAWLESLKGYAAEAIGAGHSIPGYKLVAGRTSRAWDDQGQAFDALRRFGLEDAMLYERVPLTVAKLERVMGKKDFAQAVENHVVHLPGKPTLVPASDPRPDYSPAQSDFNTQIKHNKED